MTIKEATKYLQKVYANAKNSSYASALAFAISAIRAKQEAEKNDPLTLENLRGMDGAPLWFVSIADGFSAWGIVRIVEMKHTWFVAVAGAERAFGDKDSYGKTWLAYCHPPTEKEETQL